VLQAALRLYGEEGWSAFTFDAVAREAGVGKPAIYRRWMSREHLLVAAFADLQIPTVRDCGSLRKDLRDFAMQYVDWYSSGYAEIGRRLLVDRDISGELSNLFEQYVHQPRLEAAKELGRRTKRRGEIGRESEALMAVELVIGAINTRWTYIASADKPVIRAKLAAYVGDLVEIVASGLESLQKK
jgi:AcrR family transcriptional regulator